MQHPGFDLRQALKDEPALQIVGVLNAFVAQLAERAGFRAIYLSGAGLANCDFGLPDLGLTQLSDVCEAVRRITARTKTPLLVDADTGWGSPLNVHQTFEQLSKAGAAGAHIEDQIAHKRCGHRKGKVLVSDAVMRARLNAALDGRIDDDFMVVARTDAVSVEGTDRALERALLYEEIGADMIFVEAVDTLGTFQRFTKALNVPVLANITEFGKTPMFTVPQLRNCQIGAILYPLTITRLMQATAQNGLTELRDKGTQESMLNNMMTRTVLYQLLDYENYELKLDYYLSQREAANDGSE